MIDPINNRLNGIELFNVSNNKSQVNGHNYLKIEGDKVELSNRWNRSSFKSITDFVRVKLQDNSFKDKQLLINSYQKLVNKYEENLNSSKIMNRIFNFIFGKEKQRTLKEAIYVLETGKAALQLKVLQEQVDQANQVDILNDEQAQDSIDEQVHVSDAEVPISDISNERNQIKKQLAILEKYNPEKAYENTKVYDLSGMEVLLSDVPQEFLFVTKENKVIDIRLAVDRLANGCDHIMHPDKTKEILCHNSDEFNQLIALVKSIHGEEGIKLAEKLVNTQQILADSKAILLKLPFKEYCVPILFDIRAQRIDNRVDENTNYNVLKRRLGFATSTKPLNQDEINELMKTPLKESTVDQLANLSSRLEFWGTGGDADFLKSATLNEFDAYIDDLKKDKIESLKIQSFNARTLWFVAQMPIPGAQGLEGNIGQFGKLLEETREGRICVNDVFRPAVQNCFGLLHLVKTSEHVQEKPFYDTHYT